MTDQEILTKAIDKARSNGWENKTWVSVTIGAQYEVGSISVKHTSEYTWRDYAPIIFQKSFCKALWGDYKDAQYDTHDSLENDKDTPPLPSTYSSDVHFKWLDKYAVCRKCSKSLRTYDQRKSDCGEPLEKGSMGWNYHLQRMVISEDPIKYLEENMD